MPNRYRLAAVALVLVLGAAIVPSASALVVHDRRGHFLGIDLRRGISPAAIPGSVAATQQSAPPSGDNGMLSYHGGPVLHSSDPYLIFWTPSGYTIPASSESFMERYFTDVASDSGNSDDVYGVSRQYYDSTGFADYQQTFDTASQVIIDTQSYPASGCSTSYSTCLTDAQLQAEVERLIGANPNLPNDGPTSDTELADNAPIYFVVLPSDVDVCDPEIASNACADPSSTRGFCSYHSSLTDDGNTVLYVAMPTLLANSSPKDCQDDGNTAVQEPNSNVADVVINDLSHEDNESITDPLGTAWWDNGTSANEEADDCVAYATKRNADDGEDPYAFLPTIGGTATPSSGSNTGTLYDQLINSDEYYTQSEWSNGNSTCEMHPTAGTITPSFGVSGTQEAGASLSFDPSVSASTNAISSETFDFGDGSTPAFHAGSLTSVSHTYTAPGTYTVTLTLVDNRGNLQSTTQKVTIESGPDASFTYSPTSPLEGTSVSFDAGGSSDLYPGAQITSYAWNFGDGSSDTKTTATDSHTYASGIYTVTLTVTDTNGAINTTSQQITVYSLPTASFGYSPPAPVSATPVGFNGSGSSDPDPGVTISSYAWSFGDGTTGSGATPSHIYSTPGSYTVTLTVTNSVGLTAKTSQEITIFPPAPTAGFAVATAHPAAHVPVQFNGSSSSAPDESITSYVWTFGDGSSAQGIAPAHTYARPGTYRVTLTIVSSAGMSATADEAVVVVSGGRIKKISVSARRGAELVAISLTGPGKLSVGTRRFVIKRAEKITVRVVPSAVESRRLRRTLRVTEIVPVAFTPQIGRPTKTRVKITFRS